MLDHPITLVTFLPLAVALGLLSTGRRLPEGVWRAFGLVGTLATFVLSTGLWFRYDLVQSGYQFVEHATWFPDFGIHYFVGIDGISLVLLLLTTFLMPLALLGTWRDVQRGTRAYVFCMLALETGMIGAFVSLDLFVFYVFWEAMLIPMYFLIGVWGGPRRVHAALKFFLFTMFGSLLMLVAMLVLVRVHAEQSGVPSFDLVALPGSPLGGLLDTSLPAFGEAVWWKTEPALFAAFALAFAVKIPIVPFHTWLPEAHVEAPTPASVLLAGILLKMGSYGFVRFALPLFPNAAMASADLFFTLSLVGILYGSLVAMVQADMKKLVAWSSIAHMGFIVLGIFALDDQGISGAVLQMLNHGLSTGALFLLVGFLYTRRHTRQISEFGGVARPMPVYAALFGIVAMASIGLPGLNGFVGEFLILLGTFSAAPRVAVLATFGVVLAAAYMLWMYRRVMFGPVDTPENRGLIDLGWRERSVMLALILPMLWIGLYPHPVLRRIEPAVVQVMRQMDARTSHATVAAPAHGEGAPAGGEDASGAGASASGER